jgi:hypothetical protein
MVVLVSRMFFGKKAAIHDGMRPLLFASTFMEQQA